MSTPFSIGDELTHVLGDAECPECLEAYPEHCPCRGLIHAAVGEDDAGGTEWPTTRCDRCGRPKEEID